LGFAALRRTVEELETVIEVAPVAIRVLEDPKCNSREQLLTGLGPAEIDISILYF